MNKDILTALGKRPGKSLSFVDAVCSHLAAQFVIMQHKENAKLVGGRQMLTRKPDDIVNHPSLGEEINPYHKTLEPHLHAAFERNRDRKKRLARRNV